MKVSIKDIIGIQHSSVYIKTNTGQTLIIHLPNSLSVKITVADSVFEWFVDVYNSQGLLLISNWYDHYDANEEQLIQEMRDSIIAFANEVVTHKTRVTVEKKFLSEVTIFQVQKNDIWVEYFKKSKFKF